jgi:hypothetical protein
MYKANPFVIRAYGRFILQQLKTCLLEALHFTSDIFHLKGDVMYALSFFMNEFEIGLSSVVASSNSTLDSPVWKKEVITC